MNNSYIQNQGYPGDVSSGASACATSRQTTTAALTAEYTISKAASDVRGQKNSMYNLPLQ